MMLIFGLRKILKLLKILLMIWNLKRKLNLNLKKLQRKNHRKERSEKEVRIICLQRDFNLCEISYLNIAIIEYNHDKNIY
jgi:hypothetical protein